MGGEEGQSWQVIDKGEWPVYSSWNYTVGGRNGGSLVDVMLGPQGCLHLGAFTWTAYAPWCRRVVLLCLYGWEKLCCFPLNFPVPQFPLTR